MKTNTEKTTCGSARGQNFNPPLAYEFTWDTYETKDELVAAKDELSLEEQVKVRNNERKANARNKALNAMLDAAGIEKQTAENNDQVRLRDMVKTLLTAKLPNGDKRYTEEQAKAIASTTLGIEWTE